MSGDPCDGCDREVPVAGGIANVWSFDGGSRTGGMTLELEDGTEHFLCFQCIGELDDDPSAADVATLPHEPRDGSTASTTDDGADDSLPPVGLGIVVGGAIGVAAASVAGSTVEPALATGAALGVGVALLVDRLTTDA